MGAKKLSDLDLLNRSIDQGYIKLEDIERLDYDTLEMFCNQLLEWKLIISQSDTDAN
jgi:hypothetical protein